MIHSNQNNTQVTHQADQKLKEASKKAHTERMKKARKQKENSVKIRDLPAKRAGNSKNKRTMAQKQES